MDVVPMVAIVVAVLGVVVVLGVVAIIVMTLLIYLRQASLPVLERAARVIAKRQEVNGGGVQVVTTYYVTFEFEGDDREEFKLKGADFGQLVEGDSVTVTSQGDVLLNFQRKRQPLRN